MTPVIDVLDALENWARWCLRGRSLNDYCDCPTNWQMIDQMEYKNAFLTTQEKLDDIQAQEDPDEREAIRVERAVASLGLPKRAAIRVQWVLMPDDARHAFGLTLDQWDERRARFATRRSGWYFSPRMYREAVDAATDAIEAAL